MHSNLSSILSHVLTRRSRGRRRGPLAPLRRTTLFSRLSEILTRSTTHQRRTSQFKDLPIRSKIGNNTSSTPPRVVKRIDNNTSSTPPSNPNGAHVRTSRLIAEGRSRRHLRRVLTMQHTDRSRDLPSLIHRLTTERLQSVRGNTSISPTFRQIGTTVRLTKTSFPTRTSAATRTLRRLQSRTSRQTERSHTQNNNEPHTGEGGPTASQSLHTFILA